MQLNKFTDYGLRILMYVAQPKDTPYTISELAQQLDVSENHAMKIVHFMAKQSWIITTRGKGGGIRLNPSTLTLRLGAIVKILEGNQTVVECTQPPCILIKHCGLKGLLAQALTSFYASLDQYSLADALTLFNTDQITNAGIELLNI